MSKFNIKVSYLNSVSCDSKPYTHACVYTEFSRSTALAKSNYYDNMEIIIYLEFEHTRKT